MSKRAADEQKISFVSTKRANAVRPSQAARARATERTQYGARASGRRQESARRRVPKEGRTNTSDDEQSGSRAVGRAD